jgi:hypothetical protein
MKLDPNTRIPGERAGGRSELGPASCLPFQKLPVPGCRYFILPFTVPILMHSLIKSAKSFRQWSRRAGSRAKQVLLVGFMGHGQQCMHGLQQRHRCVRVHILAIPKTFFGLYTERVRSSMETKL